jgi:hypothetical protein
MLTKVRDVYGCSLRSLQVSNNDSFAEARDEGTLLQKMRHRRAGYALYMSWRFERLLFLLFAYSKRLLIFANNTLRVLKTCFSFIHLEYSRQC